MPSRGWTLLRSQGLGVACGFATVALLGIGSFVIAFTRDGASAGVAMDDLTAFFREPSWVHAWFYLLIPVLAVYALNTALATWHHLVQLWTSGVRSLRQYAPAFFHVAFLVALLAHGIGGLWGAERGVVTLGPDWGALPSGGEARTVAMTEELHPDGTTRQVHIDVELRAADGTTRHEELGYNHPISGGGGADLLLIVRHASMPRGVRVAIGGASCEAPTGGTCDLPGHQVVVQRVQVSGPWGDKPVAWLRVTGAAGAAPDEFFLWPGAEKPLADGSAFRLDDVTKAAVAVVRARHAPGTPWALASAVLLVLGVVTMGRRWW